MACGAPVAVREVDHYPRGVCTRCNKIHYRNPVPAAGCVVEQEGRLLLARRKFEPWQGCWYFPSGFVEYGDDVEDTARREVREETGLLVELGPLFGIYSYFDDPRQHGIIILYRATIVGGTPEEFARKRDVLAAHCADVGRDPKEILLSAHVRLGEDRNYRRVVEDSIALVAEGLDLAIIYLPPPYDPAVLEPLAETIRDSGLLSKDR